MRATVSAQPVLLLANETDASGADYQAVSFLVWAPANAGTVLVEKGPADGPVPDMTEAAAWDFGKAMLTYTCEPGQALYAQAQGADVDLHILAGGER